MAEKRSGKDVNSEYSALTGDVQKSLDHSVFEDQSITPEEYYTPKTSTTIDTTLLLPQDASSKSRTKTGGVTNLHDVERYFPSVTEGLTQEQVEQRKIQNLTNVETQKGGTTYTSIFIKNIFTWFNILTFAVAIALLVVNFKENIAKCAFLVIVLINLAIGIIQEIKAKKTVDKLTLMTAPTAMVIRDGIKITIPVTDIVLDDIVYLELGKQVCADCVVVKGECEANESMLTGESVPVKKKLGEALYSGSFVSSGNCFARVVRVGDANYVARLASKAKKHKKPKSELRNSIAAIIKGVSVIIIPVAIFMTILGLAKMDLNTTVQQTAGAIIGMIPSGMFLLTSIALAVSVIKLGKRNTMVKDLYCIEMLARVDTLCLDKTGTITDGTMQVHEVIDCKNNTGANVSTIVGSMLTATEDNNQTAIALSNHFGRNRELTAKVVMPFSSQKKLSAVTFEGFGTYFLGAPEFILKDVGAKGQKIINDNAKSGYRVIMLAHSPLEIKDDKLPATRKAVAYIVIEDHIRPEAIDTIKWFKENRVAVKVISGDNPMTVSEVAKRVGVENAEKYISLDGLSNNEVREAANVYTVFGRVSPEQKRILVKAMKAKGHTVAMTGDGVNDILALREADCSVAMASGSEAARNVSHLVLMDSNFSSMPEVVKEGRRVINNIQNSSSLYLMKTFMSAVLSILSVIFLYCNISNDLYFFDTSNLLPLEMCIIGLPSVLLAFQPNKDLVEGHFMSNVFKKCIPGGVALVVAVLAVYLYDLLGAGAGLSPLQLSGSFAGQYKTMLIVAVVYTGFMALLVVCSPFDKYRGVVCLITFFIATLCLTGVVALINLIGIEQFQFFGKGVVVFFALDFQYLTFLLSIICINYFVISGMTKLVNSIKTKNKGDKSNGNQPT